MTPAGTTVTMLDCDSNRSLSPWAVCNPLPERITVLSDVSEGDLVRTIKRHGLDGEIVIVDLDGIALGLVSRAVSRTDLVITPMRAITLDATVGVRALRLIQENEEALDRRIPHAVVFIMTWAIQSRQHNGIERRCASGELIRSSRR